MQWVSNEKFSRMDLLQKLKLQGHINAIEFFGVNVRNLRELSLDMMDAVREAMNSAM